MTVWPGGLFTSSVPRNAIDGWGGLPMQSGPLLPLPPRVHVDAALTDDDIAWLNGQLALVDHAQVRFARHLEVPPVAVTEWQHRFLAAQGRPAVFL